MRRDHDDLRAGERHLRRVAPEFGPLIDAAGPCRLRWGDRRHGSHFEALARTIAFQQLAGRAASAIWARVRALVDGPFTPEAVLVLDDARLRDAGLSGSKVASLRDLAARTSDGSLRVRRLGHLPDDEVIEQLTAVRGIGTWTAHMFLMFRLGRVDVWPTGDLGVRNGYAAVMGLERPPSAAELEPLGEPLRPYRSVAAWYCWRAVETVTP